LKTAHGNLFSDGARYLTGCSSLTTQDEAAALATYRGLAVSHLIEVRLQTRPHPGWRCSALNGHPVALPVPKLLRAYLALGAKICGEPAIDREFSTVEEAGGSGYQVVWYRSS